MKTKILMLILALGLFVIQSDARQGGPFGLGAVLGSPTGLSFKYWTRHDNAVSGALAFDVYHNHSWDDHYSYNNDDMDAYLHVNYLWHSMKAIPVQRGQLPLYWGLGGRMLMGHGFALGARGCGGIEYLPLAPVDIFMELGLVIDVVGHFGADGDLGIGVRYFF
jgi:hypothetical protein